MVLDLKRGGSPYVIAALSVVFGIISVFLSDIFAVLAVAYLAATMVFDKTPRLLLSIGASLLIVVANVLCLVFTDASVLSGFLTVAAGSVIAAAFRLHRSKNECVLISVTVVSLFTVGSMLLLFMRAAGSFSISAAMEVYDSVYESLKNDFINRIGDITSGMGNGTAEVVISSEDIAMMFDSVANLGIAMIIILSFAIVGISFKLFTRVVASYVKDGSIIRDWRFRPSGVFGYFYIALYLFSIFLGEPSAFSLTVMNLYYVFMVVFAYLGYGVTVSFLSQVRSSTFAYLSVIAALVLFSSIAIQILSLVGVFFAINYGKAKQL